MWKEVTTMSEKVHGNPEKVHGNPENRPQTTKEEKPVTQVDPQTVTALGDAAIKGSQK
jgi:hypothetical protein